MNERIKQLREQAWTIVGDEQRAKGELYEAREQWERCDQVFAELIVKEAGALLMSPEFIGRSDLDWSMVLNEHFGVEE